MKFFKKFQSYGFWVSLSAALVILLNALGKAFGFSIENEIVEDVVMSIAGVLVVLGIVSKSMDEGEDTESGEDTQEQTAEQPDEAEEPSEKETSENLTEESENDKDNEEK